MLGKIKQKISKFMSSDAVQNRQLMIFIGGSIIIAIGLMSLSLWLYNESGAAQLDLSRPAYQAAREEAAREREQEQEDEDSNNSGEFAADGPVDREALEQFSQLLEDRMRHIRADAFKSDSLSDETLRIDR